MSSAQAREYALATRFLALPKARRRELFDRLQAQGIDLARLPIPRSEAAPERGRLSFAQERLWFLWQLDPDSAAYNVAGSLRLYGEPDRAALQAALQSILRRHESLRTAFEAEDGVARAPVLAELAGTVEYTDARAEYARDAEACVRRWATREAEIPFDLSRPPLVRVRLVQFGSADYGLFTCLHHIVADGWSLRLFIDEFARQYAARVKGVSLELPELPIQYADYACWQRAWLEAGELEKQLAYFRGQLTGADRVLALPTDRPRPPEQSHRGARTEITLPRALADELRLLARKQGVTLFMLGLTALKALLYRATGETEIRVGSSVANRNRVETEALIGFFVNTQVLQSSVSPDASFAQLMAVVAKVAVEAQSHQDVPFEQVASELAPERSLDHNPLFQVHYDHQAQAYAALPVLPSLRCEAIEREDRSTLFDLMLTTIEQADGTLKASFEYATDLFDAATVERFALRYARLLSQIAATPDVSIGALNLGTSDEREVSLDRGALLRAADAATRAWLETHARETPTRGAILDLAGNPLPPGLVGELHIASEGNLALEPTGERARLRSDGALELVRAHDATAWKPDAQEFESPDSAIERELASIWQAVLQVARVSVHDNFFELGGDSIVSIQVVSRARERGIVLRPKDLFAHQTVRKLAAVARQAEATSPQTTASSDAPLTPIQRAFFGRQLPAPDHYNQSVRLDCRVQLETRALEKALQRVVAQHPALRSRFERRGSERRQVADAADGLAPRVLTVAHISGRDEIDPLCDAHQRSLNPARGEVFRALYLRAPEGDSVLLLVAHHLVVDGVSWRILLEDLERAYAAARDQGVPQLPAATTPYAVWAARLQAFAASESLQDEMAYWCEVLDRVPPLPRDFEPVDELVTLASVEQIGVQLDRVWTERLLKQSGAAYRTQIQELLLAAVARAACETFEQPRIGLWLEGHGREDVFEGVDVSRTVGWFTSEYPVVLAPESEIGATIASIKEQLRSIPGRGLGYGVLTQLGSEDVRQQLTAAGGARPRIAFNYLGQFDAQLAADAPFQLSSARAAAEADPSTPLAHWLEINGQVFAGELALWIGFSPRMFRRETVDRFARRIERELRDVIVHCTTPGAGGVTPSDYPLAGLDRVRLDGLLRTRGPLADVYPVTPMQHGMLFHALYDVEPGVYVTQLAVTIAGLDPERFRAAWERALARHSILRTSFAWQDQRVPLQCVHANASLAFEALELRDSVSLERDLAELVQAQHRRGIDLERAPLWRVALIRLPDSRHHFVWTHHHLLLDGWSTARLLDEVLLDYLGRARPGPSHAFADYVAWLEQRDVGSSEKFWRERLAEISEPTLLASHTAGLATSPQSESAATGVQVLRTRLPVGETAALTQLVQRVHVTLNTLVQAAWALLLARYTGQARVVFGATTSGRPPELAGSEEILGLFINTLPIVVELQPQAAIGELWQALQQYSLDARDHEHTPLAKLQRWAGHGGGELFDSLIVFENFPLDRALEQTWQSLRFEGVETSEITNYALTLAVRPGPALELDYGFDPARIAPSAVERIAAQVLGLLHDFVALAVDTRGAALRLRGVPAQQVHLDAELVDVRSVDTSRGFVPVHRSVLERIAQRANADETLVAGVNARFRGAELAQVSARIAQQLRALGVTAETRVGLYVERGPWLIAGALGILRAGGAFVPLDPAYPRERLSWMLADAAVEIVLRTPGFAALDGVRMLDVEAVGRSDQRSIAASPEPSVRPEQLAYLIYTSGSTGTPKGVGVSHAALAMHGHAVVALYGIGEADCAYHLASASFDASVEQWVVPLLSGARLFLSPEEPLPAQELLALLRRERVTVMYPPTSQIVGLAQWLEQTGESYRLRACCVGGEAVSRESVSLIRRTLQPGILVNGYGPTETVVTPLLWRATPDMPCDAAYAPIGSIVGERSAYVLDSDLNVLPQGVAGELYLGGTGMARGYLGRPALTAERFVPDPFGTSAAARLYRTGDRVRALGDGSIEYLGRIDHQVKLRGYRIELGEIEARLLAQPEVRDAVVVVRQEGAAARLIGYVASDAAPSATELLARLREALPEHMVPAQLVVLAALPRTPNGKVDRRALPAPQAVHRDARAPRTPLERELLAFVEDVLGQPDLGVNDDFFERGGDSLSSLQLVSRANARGYRLTLKDVFARRTVEALAAGLDEHSRGPVAARIERVSRDLDHHALSYAQERLWFLTQLEPDNPAYNISGGLRVTGALDAERVRRAFEAVIARHEALRTSFEEHEGRGVQRIHAHAQLPFRLLDVSGAAAEPRARAIFAEERARPFELSSAPLLRVTLVRLEAEDHVLLVNLHHLIADGWSVRLLIREFAEVYRALGAGLEARLPEPALQYVDYAGWQRSWLEAGELTRQLEYWRGQLGEDHRLLELPLDHARPVTRSYRGATLGFALDPATSTQLAELARSLGASAFMLLLAAFESVLYRWTGQRDLRVGVPLSNRGRLETESVVGLFVNTLVMRTQLAGSLTFAELVARVKDTALDAQSHQDLPFEQLVDVLSPERNLTQNPLFQVMFDHQHVGLSPLRDLEGLQVAAFEIDERATPFDLTLDTVEEAGAISGSFTYAAELFEPETIAALAARFIAVLKQVVHDSRVRLAELSVLDPKERDWLLRMAEPRGSESALPTAATSFVHARIAALAHARPDAVALLSEDGAEWSYARLERESNQWARLLRSRGVGPDFKVGLCVDRSPRLIVASLAIFKAGGALVPLDPTYPLERLRAVVADAKLRLILGETTQPIATTLGVDACVWLDTVSVSAQPATAPEVALSADNLAYVVYTSGSTGRPKGVAVSHAALTQQAVAIGADYGMRADDCALLFASLSFDAGIEQWVSPLLHGARVLVRGDTLWSAEQAVAVLRAHGVTWFEMPPRYATEVAHAVLECGETLALRGCTVGGEALTRESLDVILRAVSPAPVINGYGPTEALITPMTWHATDASQCTTAYAPIGRVVGPRRGYVLDADLNLVAPGVTGELYLAGTCLARGYVDQPGWTAERFLPDPFAAELGQRMYRTGDLARVGADGDVEFIGRADDQVKVRGFRIELGEIEAQLLAQPGVREAAVVAEGGAVAARLIGYVAGSAEPGELLAQLRAALPEYLVPSQLVSLPTLPRNANGKLDRKRLPQAAPLAPAYVAPQTALQLGLATIWREVLQVEQVGLTDNFFELGGDSISSLRVISRARKLGLELRPRDVFERQTLAELADGAGAPPTAASNLPLVPVTRDAELYRLSYAQERLWFLAQLEPDSAAYNIAGAVRMDGALDVEALDAALAALVRRHESLRTTFEMRDGQPWQHLHPSFETRLQFADLSAQPLASAELEARAQVEAVAHRPFDLARGPLLRVLAVRLSERDHVLCVVMHHIVSDGWSLEVAIAELSALYAGAQPNAARTASLPALPVQFIDYADWQRRKLEGAELERQLAYWTSQLGDEHPLLQLPTSGPRPAVQTFRGALLERQLDSAFGSRLHGLARERGVTMFMLLCAAWQTLLYRVSGQRDIRVGVPVTNRDQLETERLIGLFVNTQVIRSEISGELRFNELLQRVKQSAIGASAHRDLPFERLVEALSPERSLSHNPLFQVTYNHASAAVAAPPPAQLTLRAFAWDVRSTQFDLSLDTEELSEQRLGLSFTYATDLFDRETIEALAARFEQLLLQLVEAPELRIAELELLTTAERDALASEARVEQIEPGLPVDARFCEQARLRPDATALEWGTERWSFAQLAAAAETWSRAVCERGVGLEARVGVCVSRSACAILAPLAIWKAGAAYVPLDPALPPERLRAIASAAHLELVLSDSRCMSVAAELGVPVLELDSVRAAVGALTLDRESGRLEERPAGARAVTTSSSSPRSALAAGSAAGSRLAYVIYTSGSTGAPKGVAVSHAALALHVAAIADDYALDAADCSLQFASTSFDAGLEQWIAPLCAGARVVLRDDAFWSAEECVSEIRARGVTRLDLTPGYLHELARFLEARGETLELRSFISGGEALPGEDLPLIQAAFPSARCINAYGPTEAVITPLTWHAPASSAASTAYAPIGRAVGPRASYVLDADLGPVPPGVPGELYLGGPILARGYLDQPEPTAERFVPDPFSTTAGARMYRTGDRVRRLGDGTLEYLGRVDHQLKLRGYRVEPGEIEAQLRAHPGVREAVVVSERDAAGGARLIGYVTGVEDTTELRARLREVLPDYMQPVHLIALAELPHTAAGKVDRSRLPAPAAEARAQIAPRTPIEHKLAEIWRDVLGVAQVSVADDFFELGGHSLLAMRVVSRIRTDLGISTPVRQLFETTSLEALAAALEGAANDESLTATAEDALRELENLSEDELAELLADTDEGHE